MSGLFNVLFRLLGFQFKIVWLIIGSLIWLIIAGAMAKAAKKYDQNPVMVFCLVFFLRIIGVIVCVILFSSRQNQNSRGGPGQQYNNRDPFGGRSQQNNGYQSNSFYEPNNPYANPNRQQVNGTTHFGGYSGGTSNVKPSYICPSCGNVQEESGFCMVCGTQLNRN